MTTHNTQNPVGSSAAKDLYDNAENLDVLVNNITLTSHPDRLGVPRKTWYGIEKEFNEFMLNSGFVNIGNYAASITVTGYNQTIRTSDGKFWRLNSATPVPYVTTGAGMPEGSAFVDLGNIVYWSQVGSGSNQIPRNSDLGTASKTDVATPLEAQSLASSKLPTVTGVTAQISRVVDLPSGAVDLNSTSSYSGKSRSVSGLVSRAGSAGLPPGSGGNVSVLSVNWSSGYGFQFGKSNFTTPARTVYVRASEGGVSGSSTVDETWYALLTGGNTTVDSNGFIKQASPIVNLFSGAIEPNDSLEVKDAIFERLGVGHYVIRNVPKLSRDGWYIETPKDRNNNIYFTIDYDESIEGELTIRTYEPDYSTGRAANGAPMDIMEGRFVVLRFEEIPELYPVPDGAENEENINPDSD